MVGLLRRRALTVSTSALAALLLVGTPDASAQNLFEMLFGGSNRYNRIDRDYRDYRVYRDYREPRQRQRQEQSRQQAQPQRVTAPRVAGPQFYEYRVDSLVRLDFAALALAVAEAERHASLPDRSIHTASSSSDRPEVTRAVLERRVQIVLPASRGAGSSIGTAAGEAQPTEAVDEQPEQEPAVRAGLTSDALEALADYDLLAEKAIAEAVVAYYSGKPDYIWIEDGRPSVRARDALRVLGEAGSHALDPSHYAVAVPGAGAGAGELARFELQLSARVLRYVRDVHGGRIDPNRISGYHDFKLKEIDYASAMETLASGRNVQAWLESQHPQNRFYRTLRAELETLRASTENSIVIAPGTFIRPGQTNEEFAKILKLIAKEADQSFMIEHGAALSRNEGTNVYSQELVPVIRAAQTAAGVQSDGIIGPRTIAAIAGESKAARLAKVELALEQLRWLPSDLSDRYVFLNAASFKAAYFENGQQRLSMRAIYGKPETQAYFFKDRVSYVEFHPYWGVPRSILVNTYLQRLYSDPGYLDRAGFEVTDSRGRRIPSSSINWAQYGANIPYGVRQLPGPRNALGELKIMFPNKHAIYMHDTPDKELFARENRAISNGCVRLEDPRAMAAAVLGWDVADVASRLRGPHSREDLTSEVPVYLTYFTAWPETGDTVSYYNDVYDRDRHLVEALARIDRVRAPAS